MMRAGERLGLGPDDLIPFGHDKAKVRLDVLDRPRTRPAPGRLILVSAITPTKAGEGKTTTSIGLADALTADGQSACLALREPSIGPCMGVKGGGTGGGRSRLTPSDDINLHFTGDMHAVTAAHNLLAATLDNHLHHGNALDVDPQRVAWRRVLDQNDRSLRNAIIGLGGVNQGIPRESGFDITAASEVMAMLCLSDGPEDLRGRLDRTLVALNRRGEAVTAKDLGVTGALMALLRDAMLPNLVQTEEGTPALVHGGPFANIAHGCSSVVASRIALQLADWTVNEAGFGFDLGAEKFFDIKCTGAGLDPAAVVLVATVRALKLHGGVKFKDLDGPNPEAVERGLPNLTKHLENVAAFGKPAIVAVNRFGADTEAEIAVVLEHCAGLGIPCAASTHFAEGGAGAVALSRLVREAAQGAAAGFQPLYQPSDSLPDKITAVASRIYGADGIRLTKKARRDLKDIERLGWADLPICVAKTQSSLSDDPRRRGRPEHFEVTVARLVPNPGAGFIVVLTGDIMRMPGLPRSPQAERIDLVDGVIVGVA